MKYEVEYEEITAPGKEDKKPNNNRERHKYKINLEVVIFSRLLFRLKDKETDDDYELTISGEELKNKDSHCKYLDNLEDIFEELKQIITENKLEIKKEDNQLVLKFYYKKGSKYLSVTIMIPQINTEDKKTKTEKPKITKIQNNKIIEKQDNSNLAHQIKNLDTLVTYQGNLILNLQKQINDILCNVTVYKSLDQLIPVKDLNVSEKTTNVRNLLNLLDGRVAISGGDNSISIYNIYTHKPEIIKKKAHNGTIKQLLQLYNGDIVSGSTEHDIKLWRLKENDLELLCELKDAHNESINCMCSGDGLKIISSGLDLSIKVWQVKYPEVEQNENNEVKIEEMSLLSGHNRWVTAMHILENRNLMTASSYDRTIRFWDINSFYLIKTISNTDSAVNNNSILELGNKVLIGSKQKIIVLDTKDYSINTEITIDSEEVEIINVKCLVQVSSNIVLVGGNNGWVLEFMINENETREAKQIHDKDINSMIKTRDNKIWCACSGGLAKICCL